MIDGRIKYSICTKSIIVKLIKKVTWEISDELNSLLTCLLKAPSFETLYIDFSETSYVDSTILGVLVHFRNISLEQKFRMVICSPNNDCETLLHDVGLNKVLTIENESPPCDTSFTELTLGTKKTIEEMELLIKEAHKELMCLNDKNKTTFAAVVDHFEREHEKKLGQNKKP